MSDHLTFKQLKIYKFVLNYYLVKGVFPTYQLIADQALDQKITRGTVTQYIEALVKKGYLLKQPNKRGPKFNLDKIRFK